MSDSLPVYKSNATPEQREKKLEFMKFQLSMIKEQEDWNMKVSTITVKCGCNKKIKLLDAYRCLYCEIWYCKECAEIHFGIKQGEQQ